VIIWSIATDLLKEGIGDDPAGAEALRRLDAALGRLAELDQGLAVDLRAINAMMKETAKREEEEDRPVMKKIFEKKCVT
jgi:hypothetical protein